MEPLLGLPGAPRWTVPERWHLTLLFLGSVPADRLPDVVDLGARAVVGTPPIRVRLTGGGRFGSIRRPSVAWTGLDGDVSALVELAARLADGARRLGLPVDDRPFRPHLTLGRWRAGQPADGRLTDRLADYCGPQWPAAELRLIESRLGPTPRYDTLSTWPLEA